MRAGTVRPRIGCPPWCQLSNQSHLTDYESIYESSVVLRYHAAALARFGSVTMEAVALEAAGPDGRDPIVEPPELVVWGMDELRLSPREAEELGVMLGEAAAAFRTLREGL